MGSNKYLNSDYLYADCLYFSCLSSVIKFICKIS
uniref:Uncharacterized protein n=1 Tax=Rhizophora mucronata TaxID=61149 RepID=A0A2P2R2G4_RHIMU